MHFMVCDLKAPNGYLSFYKYSLPYTSLLNPKYVFKAPNKSYKPIKQVFQALNSASKLFNVILTLYSIFEEIIGELYLYRSSFL